jgi:hypothetical protein
MSAIEYQTNSIYSEIPKIKEQTDLYTGKTNYQMQMYNSIKYLNQILLFFYLLLFIIIHILLLVQYLQRVKRNEIADMVWLFFFFLYPYLIYYIEKTIYFCITYLLSLIYGKTYVYEFDKLLLFTDYYADPGAENNSIFK